MPILEYHCSHCEKNFDLLIRSESERREVVCPDCNSRKIELQPSVFAAHHAAARPVPLPRAGGCGRCGDPNGSCGRA